MLLAEIPRGRRHDGPLGDDQLAASLDGQPDVFLADEVERRAPRRRQARSPRPLGSGRIGSIRLRKPRDAEELVDLLDQGVGADARRFGRAGQAAAGRPARGSARAPRSNRFAAGVISYASRLMFSRCRGEMLSDVMLPP